MNSTVVEVYGACMEVFAAQNFQDVDVKIQEATRLSNSATKENKRKNTNGSRNAMGVLSVCSPYSFRME